MLTDASATGGHQQTEGTAGRNRQSGGVDEALGERALYCVLSNGWTDNCGATAARQPTRGSAGRDRQLDGVDGTVGKRLAAKRDVEVQNAA